MQATVQCVRLSSNQLCMNSSEPCSRGRERDAWSIQPRMVLAGGAVKYFQGDTPCALCFEAHVLSNISIRGDSFAFSTKLASAEHDHGDTMHDNEAKQQSNATRKNLKQSM
jgi:hypothetical protein